MWEMPNAADPLNENISAGEQRTPEVSQSSASSRQEDDLVDWPTSHLSATPLVAVLDDEPGDGAVQRGGGRPHPRADLSDEPPRQPAGQSERVASDDEVEQLETRPMQSQQPGTRVSHPQASSGSAEQPWETQPTLPLPPQRRRPLSNGDGGTYSAFGTSGAIGQRQYQQYQAYEEPALPIVSASPKHPLVQRPVTPSPVPEPAPRLAQQGREAEQAARVVRPKPADGRPVRRPGRTRLLVVAGLLVVLLAGGFAAWLVAAHPFDVPGVTSTTVSFQNASLGVSLQYPQGWTSHLDSQHGSASFFDPNHTDQFNLNAVSNGALSVDQYIKNTIDQLGMTSQKKLTPLTFAGQSWQQVRGSVLVSGATYTETLLVTTHAARMYALLLMAPAPTYNDADRLFFSPMRSSFRFA